MIFYAYQPGDPLLQPYIRTIWYISQNLSEVGGTNPRMIPDGYYHMVINLGDPHLYIDKNGRRIAPKRSHINAKQTEYVTIEQGGHVEIMGVVFKPHGFYPFVGMPVSELTGQILNMEDLVNNRFGLLEEQLTLIPTVKEKCLALELWLKNCFHRKTSKKVDIKREITFAGELMTKRGGMIRVQELAEKLDLSERSLQRHFKTCYGVSPKQFANLRQIHNVLQHMHNESNKIIDYAAVGEYYDQAHFSRVFKNIVGVTPQNYMKNRDLLSDLYNTDTKKSGTIITNKKKE